MYKEILIIFVYSVFAFIFGASMASFYGVLIGRFKGVSLKDGKKIKKVALSVIMVDQNVIAVARNLPQKN